MNWWLLLLIVVGWTLLAALLAPLLGIGMRRADRLERRYRPKPGTPSAVVHAGHVVRGTDQPRVLDRAARRR